MRIPTYTCLVMLAASALPLNAQDDPVMKAMRDEMDRSMKQLQLENLEKPYFLAFRVVDSDYMTVSANFGALEGGNEGRSRSFMVEVRVGDYNVDNTNFFSPNYSQSSMVQIYNGTAQLPLDNDYRELRRQMWLATDATYKKSVEDLSKKRAALQNKVSTDDVADFTKEAVSEINVDAPVIHADRPVWEAEARSLSGLFRKMSGVFTSHVSFSAENLYVRYLNSDGTTYTKRDPDVTFSARASTQAADGTPLDDSIWLHSKSVDGLPSAADLTARVQAMGEHLTQLRTAKEIQNYNGPVLAEGEAAAQLFRWVFMPNLLGTHRILMDSQFGRAQPENPFVDKIGARVLPEFLSVTDNPTLAEYNKTTLQGWSKVDEDGIPTRETKLVENGFLSTLLVTRNPVRGIEHSTGSRHAGTAAPTNVFVTADNGLNEAELKAKFMDLVKRRKKDFGIVVRRMRSSASPVLAYKVYLDGHEELIHGVQFADLNAATFKEIIAASKERNLYTMEFYPARGMGQSAPGEDQNVPVTLVVPSLLFEDVTLRKTRGETPKPPVAPHPFFDTK